MNNLYIKLDVYSSLKLMIELIINNYKIYLLLLLYNEKVINQNKNKLNFLITTSSLL